MFEFLDGTNITCSWEEIPCGIYSLCLKEGTSIKEALAGEKISKHEWTDQILIDLINWERKHSGPDLISSAVNIPPLISGKSSL